MLSKRRPMAPAPWKNCGNSWSDFIAAATSPKRKRGVQQLDVHDAFADRGPSQSANRVLDFRKLRHVLFQFKLSQRPRLRHRHCPQSPADQAGASC